MLEQANFSFGRVHWTVIAKFARLLVMARPQLIEPVNGWERATSWASVLVKPEYCSMAVRLLAPRA